MKMHDYVLTELEKAKYRWPKVAEESGVPYRALMNIATGTTKNPGIENLQKLHDYFQSVAA